MSQIHVLDDATINQIAAGEVVERPSAVVKELIENAMDAGANAITAEIKEGGLSFIRITDNGAGIAKEDIPLAFLRHATSKIKNAVDLMSVISLGFRGEALSSISAVAQVELITKTPTALNGYRYVIEGGEEKVFEEIGCPTGTTIIVRNLFFNTPARRKFLKSVTTEGSHISDLMERLIISHPGVSFKYIYHNQVKLQSSGNHNSKDILYHVYGRDIAKELLALNFKTNELMISGYIGKPVINRGNRNYENYFINGRYIKSSVITKAIEDAFKPFMMQHKYPFTSLYFEIAPELIDVNVHPQKMEIRLKNADTVYQSTYQAITDTLSGKEMIPKVILSQEKSEEVKQVTIPEPFETVRRKAYGYLNNPLVEHPLDERLAEAKADYVSNIDVKPSKEWITKSLKESKEINEMDAPIKHDKEQLTLFPGNLKEAEPKFLSTQALPQHRIIGQVFSTYWLVEFQKELYIIDQHAAHEKVLYERILAGVKNKSVHAQQLLPPIVLSLTLKEQTVILQQKEVLRSLGYEIEQFGGNEFSVRAVPANLFVSDEKELLLAFIDELSQEIAVTASNITSITEKIASLSCKAAIKANHVFSVLEAQELIKELLSLENPYHCPHGRPVIVSMSQFELERKFKRIL